MNNIKTRLVLGFGRMMLGFVATMSIASGCWLGNGGLNQIQSFVNPPTADDKVARFTTYEIRDTVAKEAAENDHEFFFAYVGVELTPGQTFDYVISIAEAEGMVPPGTDIYEDEKILQAADEQARQLINAMIESGELDGNGSPMPAPTLVIHDMQNI